MEGKKLYIAVNESLRPALAVRNTLEGIFYYLNINELKLIKQFKWEK
jgi:hypothetical protein